MSRLNYLIEPGLDGELVIITDSPKAVRDIVAAVASQVPATELARVANLAHDYHEHGGASLAAELEGTLAEIADRIALTVAYLTPADALALGAALTRLALEAFEKADGPEVEL